jgi:hypothetical protein
MFDTENKTDGSGIEFQKSRATHENFMQSTSLSYGNFMRGRSIAGDEKRRQAMSQIVHLDPDTRCWARQCGASQGEEYDSVWPEVSTGYSRENPAPVNPENSQRRVLFEVGLVLAIAGIMAIAAGFLVPLLP